MMADPEFIRAITVSVHSTVGVWPLEARHRCPLALYGHLTSSPSSHTVLHQSWTPQASCWDCPAGSPADQCVCLRQCPSSVLQGLPCRQPHTGTALVQPVHRLCLLASSSSFQGGSLGLHWAAGYLPVLVFTAQLRSFQGRGLGLHWAAGYLLVFIPAFIS